MENRLDKNYIVPMSQCGNNSRLNIVGLFNTFMDLATEHGENIGLGGKVLAAQGLFWVASKTKIKVHTYPEMLQEITASTWPEKPGRIRCNRYYAIKSGDEILAEGKTEWVMVEIATGKPAVDTTRSIEYTGYATL